MTDANIVEIACNTLRTMRLASAYRSEEHDFQDAVVKALGDGFDAAAVDGTHIVASIGGTSRPRIGLFGTNVWPDIKISVPGQDKLGIELKLVRQNASLPMGIKQSIGQAFIYRLKYSRVIVFIVAYTTGMLAYTTTTKT